MYYVSTILLLSLFVFRFASERLSIQYVYERVFFFFASLSVSGCKSTTSFYSDKLFEKFFWKYFFNYSFLFPYQFFNERYPVLRGAKITSVFESHKLFWIFLENNFTLFNSLGLSGFLGTSASMRVQKYTLFWLKQGLLQSFFKVFFNRLVFWYLQRGFFSVFGFCGRCFWGLYRFCAFFKHWVSLIERWLKQIG